MSIGDFSRATHLSVRTLRRYHEAGLLEPETVDEHTGYRWYGPGQIPTAQVIHRLRDLDVPLPEVRRILATEDLEVRAGLVAGHLRRLEVELERTRAAVSSLRRLLAPEPARVEVTVRSVPSMVVAAVEAEVAHDEVLGWYAGAMAELDAVLGPRDRAEGPPGGVYDHDLFTAERGHVLVHRPLPVPRPLGRVRPVELPSVELAIATHVGDHDDIDVTYGELGAWVATSSWSVAGPVRESYLVGPRDTDDPTAWRTEIGWPVFPLTAS
ncbi:MerR family transcriptional regulator [Nocardioides marinus]|uniref:DNA-binding transcriptional MerR regulator n=1 Tax=Nocardioides marinus TaxID=374514 RepID=A0A7Y9YEU6_9ACTN|nr:MerR family transcriptional regulator [Nocardioides marinus]NYI10364.1 DNA-binding transcriptional MerR regulator [Nocardioides marinus]